MELISYAVDFVSYLLQNIKEKDLANIKSIILFGSVARGEAGAESDVDVFVDSLDEKIEKNVLNLRDKFYGSSKFKKYFKIMAMLAQIETVESLLESMGMDLNSKERVLSLSVMNHPLFSINDRNVMYELFSSIQDDGFDKTIQSIESSIKKGKTKRQIIFELPIFKPQQDQYFSDKQKLRDAVSVIKGEKCKRCGSDNTSSTQKITRSADEPITYIFVCHSCGFKKKE